MMDMTDAHTILVDAGDAGVVDVVVMVAADVEIEMDQHANNVTIVTRWEILLGLVGHPEEVVIGR